MTYKLARIDLHKKKWIIPIGIVVIIIMIFAAIITKEVSDKSHQSNFQEFYSLELSNAISEFWMNSGFTFIKLDGFNKKYEIATEPITNSEHDLYDFVEVGDSIRKNANSDTLVIIKDGKEYLYRLIRRWDYTK
jgi:hypothetical protein